jgi:hypothetical protein
MATCLSCADIETKICELADEITASSCEAVVKEGDTTFDRTAGLKAKVAVLQSYQKMYSEKKCGVQDELYEFIHVPCVTPYTCPSSRCGTNTRVRNQRRYRR